LAKFDLIPPYYIKLAPADRIEAKSSQGYNCFIMIGNHPADHIEGPIGARTIIGEREVDYFAGSGYLGLQSHPAVIQAAQDALRR
jgi:7-keto-8-aminopelargonate synthetase-like enzyme